MIGAVACFVCYMCGFGLAAILYRPMKHWQEGYDTAKETYSDWEKGFDMGFEAAKELYTDYGAGFKAGYRAAEKSAEDPRAAWCEANCHPGPACPDGYCKEVYEALREEEHGKEIHNRT